VRKLLDERGALPAHEFDSRLYEAAAYAVAEEPGLIRNV
jgi:hypothetical protein